MRLIGLVLSLAAASALAQIVNCPSDPPPDCPGPGPGGSGPPPPPPGGAPPPPPPPAPPPPSLGGGGGKGRNLIGDPVSALTGTSYHRVTDFVVETGKEPFAWVRRYHSSRAAWDAVSLNGLAKPYGDQVTAVGLNWWHGLFASVWEYTNGNYYVIDEDGIKSDFTGCTPAPCWAGLGVSTYKSPLSRLQRTSTGFRLLRPGRPEFVFEAPSTPLSGTRYFLTKIIDQHDGTTIANVQYAPPAISPPCPGGFDSPDAGYAGVPFISRVVLAGGQSLVFNYTKVVQAGYEQCAISNIAVRPSGSDGGSDFLAVSYSYVPDGGGSIALASGPSIFETYGYSQYSSGNSTPIEFTVGTDAGLLVRHVLGFDGGLGTADTRVILLDGVGNETSLALSVEKNVSYPCDESLDVCCPQFKTRIDQTHIDATSGAADASVPPTAVTTTVAFWDHRFASQPYVARTKDSCIPASACAVGEVKLERGAPLGESPVCLNPTTVDIVARKDKRDSWQYVPIVYVDGGTTAPSWTAPSYELRGAFRVGGTGSGVGEGTFDGGLERTDFAWDYSSSGDLRRKSESRPSVLGSGVASTSYDYGADGFLEAFREVGFTRLGGSVVSKTRATFFKRARSCASSANDPLKRALRIEGPCYSTNGSSCDTTDGAFPVTELYYYDSSAGGNKASRLQRVVKYANGSSCSGGLQTEYLDYTPLGDPLEIRDANGVVTAYTWTGRLIASSSVTVGGQQELSTYTYDNGALAAVRLPKGNYEVYCHRPGAGCTGTFSKRLLWQARAADAAGSTWSEKLQYEYHSNGRLKRVTAVRNNGGTPEVRSEQFLNPDVHGRPTFSRSGTDQAASPMWTVRHFDGADNLDALGPMANAAPDYCLNGANKSLLCQWMTYDMADRLAEHDAFPSQAADNTAIRTCIDYDTSGNISRVASGCQVDGGSPCAINQSAGAVSSCSPAPVDYEWDDFGNVTRVTTPWNGAQNAGAVHNYEYGAFGNVTAKISASMAAQGTRLSYVYDQLGRLLYTFAGAPYTGTLLATLGYDQPLTGSGCTTTTNYMGRLAFRYDSFGYTWFGYDEAGRLKREARLRYGACTGSLSDNPDTTYEWDKNGNLTAVNYPFGRRAEYLYGSGALTDRISSIRLRERLSGKWKLFTILSDIVWEPYGGLRGYTTVLNGGQGYRGIEYAQSTTPEGSISGYPNCTQLTLSSLGVTSNPVDGTSRLRALWVSSGQLSLGAGSGDVLKQAYTWTKDQLTAVDSCLLNSNGAWNQQTLAYDKLQRLVSVGGQGMPVRAGASYGRTYNLTRRGNRAGDTIDGRIFDNSFLSTPANGTSLPPGGWGWSGAEDVIFIRKDSSRTLRDNYWHSDRDGRTTAIERGVTWPNPYQAFRQVVFGYGTGTGPLDTVYETVSVTGGAYYEYFYDAFGRRRLKVFPTDVKQEFFHDQRNQILTDVAPDDLVVPTGNYLVVDDYVWLDGRPVAMARGQMSKAYVFVGDDASSCNRLGESSPCGLYHVVSDFQAKPVLMMADKAAGAVASFSLYDPYGFVNRAYVPFSSAAQGTTTLGAATVSASSTEAVEARLLLDVAKLDNGYLQLNGTTIYSEYYDGPKTWLWTPWATATGGSATVTMTKSVPTGYGAFLRWMEFRRYQTTTSSVVTDLRAPGQWFDPETDLHENWHRFYDPEIGSYLSSEPLMQAPTFVSQAVHAGLTAPVYAYARNNPLRFTDPDGLGPKARACFADCDREYETTIKKGKCAERSFFVLWEPKPACQVAAETARELCETFCDLVAESEPKEPLSCGN